MTGWQGVVPALGRHGGSAVAASWCGGDSAYCVPCQGGAGVGGGWGLVCRMVGRRGLTRRGVMWWGLGVCWVGVVLGLACCVEVAWWVGGVLVCHVGSARWVGGGGAGWMWFTFSRVLHAVLGQQGGLAMVGCWGRMEVARVHEWPAMSRVLRAVLGRHGGLAVAACCGPCWGGMLGQG
ncbi:hypothetical protein EDB86DRAFT_2837011 [Lactarius hatsudake]|nr:hypothetical protein EDB86DRAFT_2837011 [Lactarius hatsudake]